MPQGTVKSFNPDTGESVVLTDDLVEHRVPAETFEAAALLELRIGQRVRFEFIDDDEGNEIVAHLGLVSI